MLPPHDSTGRPCISSPQNDGVAFSRAKPVEKVWITRAFSGKNPGTKPESSGKSGETRR
jgi:hypothetical protein